MKASSKLFSMLLVIVLMAALLPAGSALAQTPTDTTGPLTSAVTVAPASVPANTPVTVTATVDDTTTGGSLIKTAEYSLNNGDWTAMSAVDGAYDGVSEAVTVTFTPGASGAAKVCVRGTDVAGNVGEAVCADFAVQYVFKGFFAPIKMGKIYTAKAGSTLPLKWQLLDANGKVVGSKPVVVGVKSYAVDCATLAGDVASATLEKAPGKSALKYQGKGRWMYNWKTLKTYKGTCRNMFVELAGGQRSPEVTVRFK